jgi:hypothetical protein
MITVEGIDDIVVNGGIVVTRDGTKIGSVEQVFLSEDSGEPAFVTVRTGLLGMSESFVPLTGATIDGSRLEVAFDRDQIRKGPRIESDRGSITVEEENELYSYYGLFSDTSASGDESASAVRDGLVTDAQHVRQTTDAQHVGQTTDAHPQPGSPSPGAPLPAGHPLPPHLVKHVREGHRPPPPGQHPPGHHPPPWPVPPEFGPR